MKNLITLLVMFVSFGCVNADITINGKGGSWDLLARGGLAIPTGDKFTFENVTVSKLSAGRLVVHHSTSQLVLENSTLSLDGNYSFTQGSLIVKGDCTITGTTGTLFTFNGHSILIDDDSTLKIKNVTFQVAPTCKTRNVIILGSSISELNLKNSTFKINNDCSGLILIGGNLIIGGSSTIDNTQTDSMYALQLGNGGYSLADCRLVVRPNSKLTVKNAGIVFKNIGSGSLDLSGGRGTLDIDSSTNANFLIETAVNLSNSTFNFDFSTLKGLEKNVLYGLDDNPTSSDHGNSVIEAHLAISCCDRYVAVGGFKIDDVTHRVYSFDGSSLVAIPGCNKNHGSTIYAISWGKLAEYIAFGGNRIGNVTHRVYRFDGSSLTEVALDAGGSSDHGANVRVVSWSPDGRYLAVGGVISGGVSHRVYRFDGISLIELVDCRQNYGDDVRSMTWSPNGKYLAVGGDEVGGMTHTVYRFDGVRLVEFTGCRGNHISTVRSIEWSHDGGYLAVVGDRYDAGGGTYITHRVYRFDGSNLTELTGCRGDYENNVQTVSWKIDEAYIGCGGFKTGDDITHRVYRFDGNNLSDALVFCNKNHGNNVYSLQWSYGGRYLAIGGLRYNNEVTHRIYEVLCSNLNPLAQFQNATLNLGGGAFRLNNIELKGS